MLQVAVLLLVSDLLSICWAEQCPDGLHCPSGYECCGRHYCCDRSYYYYTTWWFWMIWVMLILFTSCCYYYRRRHMTMRNTRLTRNREMPSMITIHSSLDDETDADVPSQNENTYVRRSGQESEFLKDLPPDYEAAFAPPPAYEESMNTRQVELPTNQPPPDYSE